MDRTFYFSLSIIVVFLITLLTGIILYRNKNKSWFSFLNSFPFELEDEDKFYPTLIYRILLSLLTILISTNAILNLYLKDFAYFQLKAFGLIILFTSFIQFTLFVIKMNILKERLIVSSLFQVLVFILYALLGIIGISRLKYQFPIAIIVIAFIIAFIILNLIISPILVNWWRMRKVKDEVESRKKFNPLAFNEWFCIFSFILLFILIIFMK